MASHGEESSCDHSHSSEEDIEQHFWGGKVSGGKEGLTMSLTAVELHVTMACLTKKVTGPVILQVATAPLEEPVAVCVLTQAQPHALLDLSFFPEDEQAHFTLAGEGGEKAEVSISGSCAMHAGMADSEDEDDEGEEEDEEEEEEEEEAPAPVAKPAAAKAAAAPAAAAPAAAANGLSGIEKLKRKRDDAAAAAAGAADAAIAEKKKAAAEARPAKQARVEGKADAGAGIAAAAGAGKDAAPTAAAAAAAVPVADGLVELAGGKLKYKELRAGSGPKASRGHKVTVK
jgi:hypothetical protein